MRNVLLNTLVLVAVVLRPCLVPTLILAESTQTKSLHSKGITLSDLLDNLDQTSPELLLSKAQVRRQQGMLKAARSNFLPNLGIVATSSLGEDRFSQADSSESWEARLELEQKLYIGGRYSATYSKSKSLLRAAEYRTSGAKNHLSFKIKEAFYRLLLAKEKISLKSELKELLESEFRKEGLRVQNGIKPEVNALRIRLELGKIEDELLALHKSKSFLGAYLLELAAFPEANKPLFSGELPRSGNFISLIELQKAAATNRSEHQRFKHLIEAAEEETQAGRALYKPELSFFANYGFEEGFRRDNDASEADSWRMGLRAKWRFFDGFEADGLIEAAKAEEEIRQHQFSSFKHSLKKETSSAYYAALSAQDQLELAFPRLEQSRKNLRLIKLRYQAGEAKQIELIQACQSVRESGEAYAEARFRVAMAEALMEKATQTSIENLNKQNT